MSPVIENRSWPFVQRERRHLRRSCKSHGRPVRLTRPHASPSPLEQVSPRKLRQKTKRLKFSSLDGGPRLCYSPQNCNISFGFRCFSNKETSSPGSDSFYHTNLRSTDHGDTGGASHSCLLFFFQPCTQVSGK